jgi:hypothetical protein
MRYKKILAGTGLLILIVGALVIRHQEAGYLAILKGDYKTAEKEFVARGAQGGKSEAYFVGVMYEYQKYGLHAPVKATKAYLKSARLGNIDGAFRYFGLIRNSIHRNINCFDFRAIANKAIQTHRYLPLAFMAKYHRHGWCFEKSLILDAFYKKWLGEVSNPHGNEYFEAYQKLNLADRRKLKALKIQKSPRISDEAFLKFFFDTLDKIKPS